MKVLPHGAIVLGMQGSETAFSEALQKVQEHNFSGYMEVRMKVRGGELWGVIVFDEGTLVESYASKMGTDVFGDLAYTYLMDLATEEETTIKLHELDANNLMDFIMSGRGKKIKIEDYSFRPGPKAVPGFELEGLSDEGERPGDGPEGDVIKKVVLLGNPAVGKTSTVRRFVQNTFDEAYLSTIGSNVNKKTVTMLDGNGSTTDVTMMIWDVAGDKACDSLKRAYYRGAHAGIIVCDVTMRSSFEDLSEWIDTLFGITGQVPVILLGNKTDLADFAQVDMGELQALADNYGGRAYPTSAKTGKNVEMVFNEIAREMVDV